MTKTWALCLESFKIVPFLTNPSTLQVAPTLTNSLNYSENASTSGGITQIMLLSAQTRIFQYNKTDRSISMHAQDLICMLWHLLIAV